MKKIFFISIIFFFAFNASAQADTVIAWKNKPFLKQFNVGMRWFDLEYGFPFQNKTINNLPYGMDRFLNPVKGSFTFSAIMPMLVFRDRFGFECKLFSFYDYKINDNDFTAYLQNKFSGYYLPASQKRYLSFSSFVPILFYRAHFKRWLIEPHVQIMRNFSVLPSQSFVFREMGSNQFIEYSIKDTTQSKLFLKGIGLNLGYRFKKKKDTRLNTELLFSILYQTGKVNAHYVITEQPYGQTATINTVDFTTRFSDLRFSIGMRFFLMR